MGQWGLPAFNLPFNVATFLFVAASGPRHPFFRPAAQPAQEGLGPGDLPEILANGTDAPINWILVSSLVLVITSRVEIHWPAAAVDSRTNRSRAATGC